MRILQVSHGFPPKENAGVELYTFYLSKALTRLNHSVHIFCREEDPQKEEFSSSREEVEGLEVTRVVNNLTKVPDPCIYYDNHFYDQIFLETLKREKPDLIHFQHFIALSANLVRIAKEEGYPIILTLHDFFILCHRTHLIKRDHHLCPGPRYGLECLSCLDDFYDSKPQDLRTKLFWMGKDIVPFPFIKWTKRFFIPPRYLGEKGYEVFHRYRFMYEMFKWPDLVLTPSYFVKDLYLKYYSFIQSKIKVLPLGVPPIENDRNPKRVDEKIRFCYFGNILPIKGVHLLIDAFRTLPKRKALLTVYGDRNPWTETYYDRLQKLTNGFSIQFKSSFRREKLSEALSDQDVVVLPSICPESFSFVIREANHLGLPVIASKIGAIPEAIKDGDNGLLFEPGNVEDLKRCMLRFIETPQLVQEMALKMPEVKSMAEHALELEKIYQGIIRRRG